jgi:hypothetical protein
VVAVLVERVDIRAGHGGVQRRTHLPGEDAIPKALRGKDFLAVAGHQQRVPGPRRAVTCGADE